MEQMKLQINNNQILNIFGKYDENIKKIEKSFAVNIINRDEDIIVSGSKNGIEKAKKVLETLISFADKGEEITEQSVNYLISEVEEDKFDQIEKINDELILVLNIIII